jgi:hypothetical protein
MHKIYNLKLSFLFAVFRALPLITALPTPQDASSVAVWYMCADENHYIQADNTVGMASSVSQPMPAGVKCTAPVGKPLTVIGDVFEYWPSTGAASATTSIAAVANQVMTSGSNSRPTSSVAVGSPDSVAGSIATSALGSAQPLTTLAADATAATELGASVVASSAEISLQIAASKVTASASSTAGSSGSDPTSGASSLGGVIATTAALSSSTVPTDTSKADTGGTSKSSGNGNGSKDVPFKSGKRKIAYYDAYDWPRSGVTFDPEIQLKGLTHVVFGKSSR